MLFLDKTGKGLQLEKGLAEVTAGHEEGQSMRHRPLSLPLHAGEVDSLSRRGMALRSSSPRLRLPGSLITGTQSSLKGQGASQEHAASFSRSRSIAACLFKGELAGEMPALPPSRSDLPLESP